MAGQNWKDQWRQFNDEYVDSNGTIRLYPGGPSIDGTDEANADLLDEINEKLSAIQRDIDWDRFFNNPLQHTGINEGWSQARVETLHTLIYTLDVKRKRIIVSDDLSHDEFTSVDSAVNAIILRHPANTILVKVRIWTKDSAEKKAWFDAHPTFKNVRFEVQVL